jgi:iron complex outermembrane receptor protein
VDAALVLPGNQALDAFTGSAPKHQVGLRTSLDLSHTTKLDLNFRWVGALSENAIKAYAEADVRFAWEFQSGFELVVAGQNLLHARHAEFGPKSIEPGYWLQRGVYVKLTRRF